MPFDSGPITARVPLPHVIVAGSESILTCPLYRSAALVNATSCSATVRNASGQSMATGGAVVANVARLVLAGATTTAWLRTHGYAVEWSIGTASGTVDARQDAFVCRTALYPVITDGDLIRRHSILDPASRAAAVVGSTVQDAIDEAWTELMLRVIEQGRRPQLVLSPSSLREAHLYLALSIVFGDIGASSGGQYGIQSQEYRRLFEDAFARVRWVYDSDDDGIPDEEGRRQSGTTQIWLTGR